MLSRVMIQSISRCVSALNQIFLSRYVKSKVYANRPTTLNEFQNNIHRKTFRSKCLAEWWTIAAKESIALNGPVKVILAKSENVNLDKLQQ